MKYSVVVTEQAAWEIEEAAAWWARERSAEQAERWYEGIRDSIGRLDEEPLRRPLSAENGDFSYELRELHYGLGSRPTHRAVFTIIGQTVVVLAVRHVAQDRILPWDF
jgi:plasmid stabilization system protein ParE